MGQYKLLALDLDETVLTSDKQISNVNKKWIAEARQAGIIVVLATGRGLKKAEPFYKELCFDGPIVLANGAEIWKKPGELLKRYYMDKRDIQTLYTMAIESNSKFWGYYDDGLANDTEWTEDYFENNFFKFGMINNDQEVVNQLRSKLQMNPKIKVTWSRDHIIEISNKGVSKETGIKKLCESIGVAMSEVMAIGDNINDLELIQSVGLGIAMGNAEEELKQVADKITDTNNRDGVAKAIQQYLFEFTTVDVSNIPTDRCGVPMSFNTRQNIQLIQSEKIKKRAGDDFDRETSRPI